MAFVLLMSLSAWARSTAAVQKSVERRSAAQAQVAIILSGGNAHTAVNRLRALEEDRWAVTQLAAVGGEVSVRRNVALALAELRLPEADRALGRRLSDPDASVRMAAARGLSFFRSSQEQALLPLLADPTSGVREQAARALGATGSLKAGKALWTAARREQSLEAKVAMLEAVGAVGDRRQVLGLEGELKSTSEATRFAAGRALCLLGAKQGLAFAATLLSSPDPLERLQGLAVLEGVRHARATRLLRQAATDSDARVSAGAARRLYQAGETARLGWLVRRAEAASREDRRVYEAELEPLQLTEAQRRALAHAEEGR